MFASTARSFARRAPLALAAAGGASMAMPAQFTPEQFVLCEETIGRSKSTRLLSRTTSGLNARKPIVVDMKTGTRFLQLFKAEYKDESSGEVDMSKELGLSIVTVLMEGAGGSKKQAKAMFNDMDPNHSGYITYSNIIAYFLNHASGTHQEKMSFLFHACDADFSNKIEPHELKAIIHSMMAMKTEADGKNSLYQWHPVLYADIPDRYVLHMKSNELVNDIFTNAHGHRGHEVTEKEELTEKEFIAWHARGGKQAKRLDTLFNIDHMSHH